MRKRAKEKRRGVRNTFDERKQAMRRHVDPPIDRIKRNMSTLCTSVDQLVAEALIALKEPVFADPAEAERQDQTVNDLEKQLQGEISETLALHQPVACDHRYLLAALATITDLEHMGDSAKHLCRLADEIGPHSRSFLRLLDLVQQSALGCFRILRQAELVDTDLSRDLLARRIDGEEIFEEVSRELSQRAAMQLTIEERQKQLLAAWELKQLCDCAAGIVDQVVFFRDGVRQHWSVR
jgi:phosphate transport system protein